MRSEYYRSIIFIIQNEGPCWLVGVMCLLSCIEYMIPTKMPYYNFLCKIIAYELPSFLSFQISHKFRGQQFVDWNKGTHSFIQKLCDIMTRQHNWVEVCAALYNAIFIIWLDIVSILSSVPPSVLFDNMHVEEITRLPTIIIWRPDKDWCYLMMFQEVYAL